MDSRFRKELTTVPPVRIKVGRHGFMTMIGWRGEVAGGGARTLRQIGDPRFSGPLPTDPFLIPGTRKDFGDGNVSEMTSPGLSGFKELLLATRRRELEIKADTRKVKWQLCLAWTAQTLGWMSLISVASKPVRQSTSKAVAARRSEVEMLDRNLAATRISVNFNMDSEVAEPHRRMRAAFDQMASSRRAWSVQTTQHIDRVKARRWAGTVMSRGPAILRRLAVSLVDTDDSPLAIDVLRGKSTAYFYPGFVLVDGGQRSDIAVIDITELEITSGATSFEETESVPSDAQVIGSTWAKANKDGSRDRRFAHNREVPIMRYGLLTLSTARGMNEAFMFSNAQASAEFGTAAAELKQVLTTGPKVHRLQENRSQLDGPPPQADGVTQRCPSCGTGLRLPKGRSGAVRCPKCGIRFNTTT